MSNFSFTFGSFNKFVIDFKTNLPEMKGDAVEGLREIYINLALARFIWHRLSFTVGDSVPDYWVKLGANDLNCVDVPLNPTHLLTA